MNYVRKSFSGNDENEISGISDVTTLSFGTRIKWFLICFVTGFAVSILGSALLFLPRSGLILFGLFYTVGNLLSIGSTMFLMGPMKQLQKMFAETRWIACTVMFIFMALTLMSALWWGKKILVIIFCILQFLAMTWYSISYIPYARTAIVSCFNNLIS